MERKGTSQKRFERKAYLSKGVESIRPFRTAEEGATIVEMALTSSILFLTVFGIIISSLALYSYDFIADAARLGARYAIVRGSYCTGFSDCGATESQISDFVKGLSYPGVNSANLTVTAQWYNVNQVGGAATTLTLCANSDPTGCNTPRKNAVAVKVVYAYPLNLPFYRSTTLNMTSISQLVISQ